ncbi:hypothetical protein F4780DRAFT_792994 [Xylariomycetidae sp. FL0641]|nr:hypothetical protein F4780DRAFT_792994 [Xylariomycetidae sp. FL0641]
MQAFSILTALAALVGVVAGDNVTGPFALSVTGKTNASIDGYLIACHAGAIEEALCYSEEPGPVNGPEYEFYFNTTDVTGDGTGFLSWILQYTDANNGTGTLQSSMWLAFGAGSNVATAYIYAGTEFTFLMDYYQENGTFYVEASDDTHFNETTPSGEPTLNLENFHLCYQWTNSYYYYSIAWVTTPPPQNPSCQPVTLRMEPLAEG